MKTKLLYFFALCFFMTTANAQNDSIYFWKSGQLIHKRSIKTADLDSITFYRPNNLNSETVTICNQIWSTKNLDVTTYSDGTPIPQVQNPSQWNNLTVGAWCYYQNDSSNGPTYGKLYNWYAVMGIHDVASQSDPSLRKKLAPNGWHIPTDDEWTTLSNCLGGENVAGGKIKQTGTTNWQSPNTGATNESGFNAVPGGFCDSNQSFANIFTEAYWWSSTQFTITTTNAWYRNVGFNTTVIGRSNVSKKWGLSVRCVKD